MTDDAPATCVAPVPRCCCCGPTFPSGNPRPAIPVAVVRYRLLPTRTDEPAGCLHVRAALAWPGVASPCWVYACGSHLQATRDLGRVFGAEPFGTETVERKVKD